jgi:hypothetical protein
MTDQLVYLVGCSASNFTGSAQELCDTAYHEGYIDGRESWREEAHAPFLASLDTQEEMPSAP